MKLKIGDNVKIMAGKDKGKTGEISKILSDRNKVVVKGVNIAKRHLKSREGIEGGIYPVEKPVPTSSVALIDPVTKEPTRVGYKVLANGKKVRIAKKSGSEIDKPVKAKAETKKTSKKSATKKS